MNGLWDRTPMWVQVVFLTLFALFGQGCGAQVIARASGTPVNTTRLHRAAHQPVREATPAERSAFEQSLVLTAHANGYCQTASELDEAGFNACRAELINGGPYLTFACLAGCNDSGLRQVCLEHRLPTTLESHHATQDGRSAFGQTYTCAQAVELVMREHSLELAELNQRRVHEDELAQARLANLRRERDEAREALARQEGAPPTTPGEAPLAEAPPDVNRGDAERRTAERRGRHHREGGRRALREANPAQRDAVARPERRVRGRRHADDNVVCMGSRALDDAIVAAVQTANAPLAAQVSELQRRLDLTTRRVEQISATIAQLCPNVNVSVSGGWERCTRAVHADLSRSNAGSADAGVRTMQSTITADAGVTRRASASPPPSANTPQTRDPPPSSTDQSLRKGVGYGVLGLVLLIGVLGLLRILLPGTRGPAG